MYTNIVVALDVENGIYTEVRGIRTPIMGITTPEFDGDRTLDKWRDIYMWACTDEDVPEVVNRMSTAHIGKDIKTFKLAGISTRAPGELKSKYVSKDGVFP